MKKKSIYITLVVLFILALFFLIYTGRLFKISWYVALDCDVCSQNIKDLNDCQTYLQNHKNDQTVIDMAKKLSINLDDISKTVKKITYPEGKVSCLYYGQ